ncbi:hypothetical protein [Shinella zoogloeoides]|uniref:hypothetical protein n=1 Tax=Shinella zoogloeoides TaxID=352475 RepID=UPI00273E73E0|nr:hypothetical protein [Shinella zoogloeoides]WLR90964.1 hypothetical protein Q9316_00880 [Shinella zoogloeoides]
MTGNKADQRIVGENVLSAHGLQYLENMGFGFHRLLKGDQAQVWVKGDETNATSIPCLDGMCSPIFRRAHKVGVRLFNGAIPK